MLKFISGTITFVLLSLLSGLNKSERVGASLVHFNNKCIPNN